jgi:hypothetical protein
MNMLTRWVLWDLHLIRAKAHIMSSPDARRGSVHNIKGKR